MLVRWMDSFENIFFLSNQLHLDLMIVAILFLSSLNSIHAKAIFCKICNLGFKVNCTPTMLVFSPILCSYPAAEILGRIPLLVCPVTVHIGPSQDCKSSCLNLDASIVCTKTISRWKKHILSLSLLLANY